MKYAILALLMALMSVADLCGSASGVGSFSNDDASDWVANELSGSPQRAVERAIKILLESREYLQVTECSNAVAACEVLAAAQGRPAKDLPPEVAAIAKRMSQKQSDELRAKAKAAIEKVLKEGELQSLWSDSEHYKDWLAVIDDLKSRI